MGEEASIRAALGSRLNVNASGAWFAFESGEQNARSAVLVNDHEDLASRQCP